MLPVHVHRGSGYTIIHRSMEKEKENANTRSLGLYIQYCARVCATDMASINIIMQIFGVGVTNRRVLQKHDLKLSWFLLDSLDVRTRVSLLFLTFQQ